jgi:bifunctional non-homologous end joining protein LigD
MFDLTIPCSDARLCEIIASRPEAAAPLLHLDGEDLRPRPLSEREDPLAALLANATSPLHHSDHQLGHGRAFHPKACAMSLEGTVSKCAQCGLRARQSRVCSWWPAGRIPKARALFSARLLANYDPDGRLVYADRVGGGINTDEL